MVIVAVCAQCQIILPGVELYLIEQGTDGAGGQQAVKMPLLEVGDTQRPASNKILCQLPCGKKNALQENVPRKSYRFFTYVRTELSLLFLPPLVIPEHAKPPEFDPVDKAGLALFY